MNVTIFPWTGWGREGVGEGEGGGGGGIAQILSHMEVPRRAPSVDVTKAQTFWPVGPV